MAVTIDPGTRVIHIPQADLTPVSGTLYELDVEALRVELKGIEDDLEYMAMDDTHRHNTAVTLSGVTYARTFEIINGYTVTFEDTGSHYTVRCVGANHNIADVLNFDAVNLLIGNSAGLIEVATGAGPSAADIWEHAISTGFTAERMVKIIAAAVAGKVSGGPDSPVFRDLTDTTDMITGTADSSGNRTSATYGT